MRKSLLRFYDIAEYGNANWKGNFTQEEVQYYAKEYYEEYKISKEQGAATHTIEELCKLLIEDMANGSTEAENFLQDIVNDLELNIRIFYCDNCNKEEIVFFSHEEIDNLTKHQAREMLIQDAIPNKPQWIRETFVSGICKCPDCWEKYWNGETM